MLAFILSSYEKASIILLPACLVSTIVSGLVINSCVRLIDQKSISSLRRILGLFIVSTLIWLMPILISLPFSPFLKDAVTNEFLFGGFLVWGFELVVINGAFLRSIIQSVLISAIHPIPLMIVILYAARTGYGISIPFSGLIVLLIAISFLVLINRIETRNGITSFEIMRAFLKTWVVREPAELEGYFSKYARTASVSTSLLIAQTSTTKIVLVVPGIHPGPFAPVGSYNLSELMYDELKDSGIAPVILHGVGGHEMNVPSNQIAHEYARSIVQFVRTRKGVERLPMKGPLRSKVGITNITTLAFGSQILSMVSNSPYLSDDLDPSTIQDAYGAAGQLGVKITLIDAHNSVDGEEGHQEKPTKQEWKDIIQRTLECKETAFKIAVANSHEVDFTHGADISDGGLSLLMFATEGEKYALISADSNNAKSGLKEKLDVELANLGVTLIDLCTSDTHKLAARNLTNRGYFALGEQTNSDTIVECLKKLLSVAESRLAECGVDALQFTSVVPLIGEQSLDDFADLTKRAISTTKNFARFTVPVLLLLLTITLFY